MPAQNDTPKSVGLRLTRVAWLPLPRQAGTRPEIWLHLIHQASQEAARLATISPEPEQTVRVLQRSLPLLTARVPF
jgi:hypothetical protein